MIKLHLKSYFFHLEFFFFSPQVFDFKSPQIRSISPSDGSFRAAICLEKRKISVNAEENKRYLSSVFYPC